MKKILIIEDSKAFSDILSSLINKQLDINCDVATDYHSAAKLLAKNHQSYFAVSSDIHIPGSEHGEVIELIEQYKIPCIVLTGDITDKMRKRIHENSVVVDYQIKTSSDAFQRVIGQIKRLIANCHITALIVDDSTSISQYLAEVLQKHCFTTVECKQPSTVLRLIEENPDIKLILVDGELEQASGVELTKQIRKSFAKRNPIIIGISGVYTREQSVAFLKAGANDFLTKPILVEELIARINQNLNMYEYNQQLEGLVDTQKHIMRMVAHDIRNPLGNIENMSHMIMDGNIPADKTDKFLLHIHSSAQTALELLNRLTQLTSLNSTNFHLEKTLTTTSELVEQQIANVANEVERKNLSLSNAIDSDLQVMCDQTFIKQVLENLITNAVKYSPIGCSIELVSQRQDVHWYFAVCDIGCGINLEQQKQLFKPFGIVGNIPTGGEKSTGMGLSIAKKIIDLHGGIIGYQDNNPTGSLFYFKLPC